MVSRRNFFSIFIMMAALLFMFQFSQIFKESGNDYGINEHVSEEILTGAKKWQSDENITFCDAMIQDRDYVVYIGDVYTKIGNVVKQWANYNKKNIVVMDNADEYIYETVTKPELIIMDSDWSETDEKVEMIEKLSIENVPIVLCGLPDISTVKSNKKLQHISGIKEIRQDRVTVDGIYLMSRFLIGGEALYKVIQKNDKKRQDMNFLIPWYVTGKGTKTYLTGIIDNDDIERDEYPAIIWRNMYNGTLIFTVTDGYMESIAGLGLLNGIVYESKQYDIYPVVNAQNVLLVDYPGFAPENEQKLMEIYGRDAAAVQRDVMWPGIAALAERNKLKLTCYFNPQYNYDDENGPKADDITFYLQQLNEIGAEAGKSMNYSGNISLGEKNRIDQKFYESAEGYKFVAVYADSDKLSELGENLFKELKDVRAISTMYNSELPILSYYNDNVTLQCATGTSKKYTFAMDFEARGLQTALAYSNVMIDMHPVMWPQTKEDQWENYFDTASSNISTYWTGYKMFDRTTIAESDKRVRDLLNGDYKESRNDNVITLETFNSKESWFILRTHGEKIENITGGEYERIENDAYLIHVMDNKADIVLGASDEILSYGSR